MYIARRFAVAGFLISILFFLFWAFVYKFNFFHLPTFDNPPAGNYHQPASRALLERINSVLCPPMVVMVIGMDLGNAANAFLATIVVVLNTVLYFTVGLLVGSLWNKLKSSSST